MVNESWQNTHSKGEWVKILHLPDNVGITIVNDIGIDWMVTTQSYFNLYFLLPLLPLLFSNIKLVTILKLCILIQIEAENEVLNESWDKEGSSKQIIDSIGLMVYEGTQSLNYVKNFVKEADKWEGKKFRWPFKKY